jgi:hypothetical protein
MKPIFAAICLAVLAAGCGKAPETTAAPPQPQATNSTTTGNPLTAPVDYLGAVNQGMNAAIKTADSAGIGQAVKMFQVQEGRFPKSLEELVEKQYLPQLPKAPYGMKFDYNPKTGELKFVKQ